ncbi:uroporphyrinogen-III synthase [Blochmannia endosymbiont of Camponotus (Colobopsis) obliquus]|uniref:uroporphyrinogen-III synthase n=1 Tax=Blochmannia endosymbiont of Camponotus (Colobopsis) obliquus TaxID=1505597 RepID=UPI00061A5B39|nr:uroporphyrinogen-III synthase [Blochmannia endosymbiont of Camponotus (Colobopsis) obliquus]AKC60726.1 Uroporphyrinogen-III synthase [Blochmannia endosymbiont of Camponotus (Colobopsis) obliquus]
MNILVTRPSPAGEELVFQLTSHGKKAWHLPLITCYPSKHLMSLTTKLNHLSAGDLLFTISQHAINYANSWLKISGTIWPSTLNYYSIGRSSGLLMNKLTGCFINFPKKNETSEELLQLPSLNHINGKRILILNSKNGRNILEKTLKKKGGQVDVCECYYRNPINYNGEEQAHRIIKLGINTLVITSGEMLQQLYYLLPKKYHTSWLLKCKLIVVSKRLALQGYQLGWQDILITKQANNTSLLKTILKI